MSWRFLARRRTPEELAKLRADNDRRAQEIQRPMTAEERRAHAIACNEEMHRARVARGEDLPDLFDQQGDGA